MKATVSEAFRPRSGIDHFNVLDSGATLAKFEVPEAEQHEVVAFVQSLKKEIDHAEATAIEIAHGSQPRHMAGFNAPLISGTKSDLVFEYLPR
jgi:predicted nucleic acid-binding protein